MAEVPKFAVPFQIGTLGARTIEQDSTEEIMQCVEAILRTPQGTREERPEFGTPDVAFATQGRNAAIVDKAVHDNEPRATVLVTEQPDLLDNLIDHITVRTAEVRSG